MNWRRIELTGAFRALVCALLIVMPLFLVGLLPKPWAGIVALAWWFLVLPGAGIAWYRRTRRRWRAEQERAKKAEESFAVELHRALLPFAYASDDTDAAKAGLQILQVIQKHTEERVGNTERSK